MASDRTRSNLVRPFGSLFHQIERIAQANKRLDQIINLFDHQLFRIDRFSSVFFSLAIQQLKFSSKMMCSFAKKNAVEKYYFETNQSTLVVEGVKIKQYRSIEQSQTVCIFLNGFKHKFENWRECYHLCYGLCHRLDKFCRRILFSKMLCFCNFKPLHEEKHCRFSDS